MAYKQRWADYFDLLDGNGNGFIEPSDAEVLVKRAAAGGALSAEAQASLKTVVTKLIADLIKAYDANKDGKVSKEEWANAVEKSFAGKPIDQAPDWWKEQIVGVFKVTDTNNSGELSEDEVTVRVIKQNPSANPDEVRAAYKKVTAGGKWDVIKYQEIAWTWATSPNPEHEVVLLTPFLKKQH